MDGLTPAQLSQFRLLLVAILCRNSRVLGGKSAFSQMGYNISDAQVRQGELRFHIQPDPHPQSMPILRRIIQERLPPGTLGCGTVASVDGLIDRAWLSINAERMTQLTYPVTPWRPAVILALLLSAVYVWLRVLEMRDRMIL
jgi:hypothetical protein